MLSVIIPVRRKEEHLKDIIENIPEKYEVIVAGKNPKIKVTRKYIYLKNKSEKRSVLMNIGAKKSSGDIFLFLHPDTFITKNALEKISKLEKVYVGGGVEISFYPNNRILDLIAFGSNIRMKYFHVIYGDQCIFVRRKIFKKVGGFKETSICEDIHFSSKLRGAGQITSFRSCKTSSRRFIKRGTIKQFFINQIILFLYLIGTKDKTLRRIYGK